jgi:hypothetical protein
VSSKKLTEEAELMILVTISAVASIGLLVVGVWLFHLYRLRKKIFEGLPSETTPDSVFEAKGRDMTRAKLLAVACALVWPSPVVLALNFAGANGVTALAHEFGYGLIYTLLLGAIVRLVKMLIKRPYLDEFRVSQFLLLSVVGLVGIWLLVIVYDLRRDPCLWEELKKVIVNLITKTKGE